MRRFNLPSGFNAGLMGAGVLVLVEVTAGAELFRRLQGDRRDLATARAAATRSLYTHFAPGSANESAIRADLVAVEAEVEALHHHAEARALRPINVASRDAVSGYFALGQWIETARAHAADQGIVIRSGECFGFRSHLTLAPRSEWRDLVAEQHAAAAQLVEWIVESRPASLESLQREHPETVRLRRQALAGVASPNTAPVAGAGSEDPLDFFSSVTTSHTPHPGGERERMAFKIVSTGDTTVLLRLVERLSADDSPFILRDLAVEKIEPVKARASSSHPAAGTNWAGLGGTLSRFTLVVDLAYSAPVNAEAPSLP